MRVCDVAEVRAARAGVLIDVSIVVRDAADYRVVARALTSRRLAAQLRRVVYRPLVRVAQPHNGTIRFMFWPRASRRGFVGIDPRLRAVTMCLERLDVGQGADSPARTSGRRAQAV